MSKINAIRLINLNYNNNAIKVSDDIFHINGESTLLSLRNGGGKSVLVQMVMSLFVHKRYRDAKDRPFESYFTTPKSTFILVEWVLDKGAGYLLTGMMVRRSQNTDDSNMENLDMINIISEYKQACLTDIHNLPVVEKGKKEIVLKNFAACRQMFEDFRRDSSLKFYYYDMSNYAQSKQYFDRLREYQINYEEWESIIREVNKEESGLSNLFANCRDEKGLVEKWFLKAVGDKLNKEKDRIKEFQAITEKYTAQYKDNESKIKRRDTIRLFKEEGSQIEGKALQYQEAEERKLRQENKIAAFIDALNMLRASTQEKLDGVEAQIAAVRKEAERIEYEKWSVEYYKINEEQYFHISNRDMIGMEQEALERECQDMENRLALLDCARQQEKLDEHKAELDEVCQALEVCQRKNEDLMPERNLLGYMLKCHYEEQLLSNAALQKETDAKAEQAGREIATWSDRINELESAIYEDILRKGSLKSRVEAYSEQEEIFNKHYRETLARNIVGSYEAGSLEIMAEAYKKEIEEELRRQNRRRRQAEDLGEQIKGLERQQEEQKREHQNKIWEQTQEEKLRLEYEEELKVRDVILKYLDMDREERFDTDKIIKASERKMEETAQLKRSIEKEEDEFQKEYQKLINGKLLELPGELEHELENIGIHVTYGMEWLRKNGYSEQQNREIVQNHPFLPYGLILSEKELEKLSLHIGDIYTSYPIPIIRREKLELKYNEASKNGIITLPDISFYMLFNEKLLNEEALAALVKETEQKIRQRKDAAAIRDAEYREYFERKEAIKNQKVSKERYVKNEDALTELKQQAEQLSKEISKTLEALAQARDEKVRLEKEILSSEKEIAAKERKTEDFQRLCKAYEAYEQDMFELKKCEEDIKAKENKKTMLSGQLEKQRAQLRILERNKDSLVQEEKELNTHALLYIDYSEMPRQQDTGLDELNIDEKEARFKAITSSMSQELQKLETDKQKALRHHQELEKELERLRDKYKLAPRAWVQVRYSRKEEKEAEAELKDLQEKAEEKKLCWNEEDKQAAVLKSKMDTCLGKIRAECKQEAPLPMEDIREKDFEAEKNKLQSRQQQLQGESDSFAIRLQSCDENLTALAEYNDLPLREPVEWEEAFEEMNREQLRGKKGILVRDYKAATEECHEAREQIERVLNRIVRVEAFADDFYRKPLEAMLELTEDASAVLRQLHTTIQSYDNLMEKLEVDISIVEKEKEKIVELMEDYIKEVHSNLGKIDSNSTITVREHPLKMLRLQLPEWEENENLYRMRLSDMIDVVTKEGIEIFERNENAHEHFGTKLTTEKIYDAVVGIGNIQVKLYKIEEQREYLITWAEVAKNSGGEGFLSAFVILSSLLYYMRRDDTDLFADRNEGKVLIMDNPFAQTNASHLLKPLMDMAKKTNTQLICLTGLGGESIYNRFDNIYVLNLVAASLRSGIQYLKAEHLKGAEPETMVVSQIEVTEQMRLELPI